MSKTFETEEVVRGFRALIAEYDRTVLLGLGARTPAMHALSRAADLLEAQAAEAARLSESLSGWINDVERDTAFINEQDVRCQALEAQLATERAAKERAEAENAELRARLSVYDQGGPMNVAFNQWLAARRAALGASE